MPWPHIFFKKRVNKTESIPSPGASTPETPSHAAKSEAAPSPATAITETKGPAPAHEMGESKFPRPPIATLAEEMAAADPIKMLARTGALHLTRRTAPLPDLARAHFVPPVEKKEELSAQPKSADASGPPEASFPAAAAAISFRRRAKMIDVARLVSPPVGEKPPEPFPAVTPPSFPVPVTLGNVLSSTGADEPAKTSSESHAEETPFILDPDRPLDAFSSIKPDAFPTHGSNPAHPAFVLDPEGPTGEQLTAKGSDTPSPASPLPTSAKPEDGSREKEIFKTDPSPASTFSQATEPLALAKEKREFLLANGERILGHVLSETPDSFYLDHNTLGVLTIPKNQIATRLVEVILINGDRVVGDLVAESPEHLYVRHASLGMLTVPRTQRSTRVVEAILKDGDRILGEVLAETENFTVIRSATLGTVAVQHQQVALLNRKIEQSQLKALPPPSPPSENKPA